MNILCLITARGGSKRVPGKNIKDFLGKPLLAWTIDTALKSKVFDRIVLSTEDKAIAEVGKKYGAEVPFMRPVELSSDTATSLSVVRQAVQWLKENQNYQPDWVILLEPTSPGRQPFHLQEVAEILAKEKIDSLIAISEMPGHYSPFKSLRLNLDSSLVRWYDGELPKNFLGVYRNQDLPKSYFHNSSIYAFKPDNFSGNSPNLWGNKVYGYLMDYKYAMDIDTAEEWMIAEIKMKELL